MPPETHIPLAPVEQTVRRRTVLVSVLLVLLLVITVIAAMVFLRVRYGSFLAAWSSIFMPHEFSNALFVGVDEKGGATAYRYEKGSFTPVAIPAGATSIAASASHLAATVARSGFNQLSLDGTVVLESTSTLSYISISPDGTWIGASESTMPAATSTGTVMEPLIARDARDWNVVLFSQTRPKVTVAVGSSPVFASGMLIWLDPRGIVGMKLSDGIQRVLAEATSTSLAAPLVASPDGTHVALRDRKAHRISVYRVEDERATLEGTIPDRGAPSFAVGNDAVYLVRVNPDAGTEIWKESFDGNAARAATIPASLRITRILLPSP